MAMETTMETIGYVYDAMRYPPLRHPNQGEETSFNGLVYGVNLQETIDFPI